MKTAEHQILTRIGFAERWLQRAREECLDGEVARGLLTLVLADAEVRRVLQLVDAPAQRSRPRLLPFLAVSLAGLAAAALALQPGMFPQGTSLAESAALAPGMTLRAGTGALLTPVDVADSLEAVPVTPLQGKAATIRTPKAKSTSAETTETLLPRRAPSTSLPPVVISTAPVVAPVPAQGPASGLQPASSTAAPPVVPAPASVHAPPSDVSDVDLLDLVIVADRTLRRSQQSP